MPRRVKTKDTRARRGPRDIAAHWPAFNPNAKYALIHLPPRDLDHRAA